MLVTTDSGVGIYEHVHDGADGPCIAVVQYGSVCEIYTVEDQLGIRELERYYKEVHGVDVSIRVFQEVE